MPKDGFFRSVTENDQTITLLSKKILERFRCNRRLQFWEIRQKYHAKSPIILLNDQNTWAEFVQSKETFKKCSVEQRESGFDNAASIFCLIVQTFLLQVRKWVKKQFFYKFLPPSFFCNIRLFLWHPDFFVNRLKICSNSKTDEQKKLCFKNFSFLKICL